MEKIENKIQWQPLIEMIIVLVTILGSTIPLHLHTDSKIEEMRKETAAINARADRLYEMFIDLLKERK